MTEQADETQTPETQPDGAEGDGTTTEGTEQTDALAPAEDADGQVDAPEQGHVSNVTDLPEGAETDPLTDQQPVPVVESETHDG